MTPSPVLRFVRFRPLNLAFDGDIRAAVIPDLIRLPGLVDHYFARQGPDEIGLRVAATIWESEDAMTAAVGPGIGGGGFHVEFLERITDASLQVLPLAVVDRYDTERTPLILRCFEGRTRPGERDAFIKEERSATQAKVKAGSGPLALYVGVGGDDTFLRLSTWPSWSDVEAATGGKLEDPIWSLHPERVVSWELSHYEISDR